MSDTTPTTTTSADTWASLIEVDDNVTSAASVAAPVATTVQPPELVTNTIPDQSPPPMRAIPGVTVDQEGVRRAKRDEAAAIAAGFSLKPPVYQMGTLVNEIGRENFKKSRMRWDEMPLLGEACAALVNQINAERREDIQVEVPRLFMDVNGLLHVPEVGALPLTHRAIEGLGHFVTEGGANYLANVPAPLRAYNFNQHFPTGFRVDKRLTKKSNPEGTPEDQLEEYYAPKKITLRTRNNPAQGGREVFAVTGPRYGTFDINQVIERVYKALSDKNLDARVDWTYDGYRARFDVLFHTPVQPEKCVAGEIFKAGLIIRTADDGSGSINVATELWRNLCLNLLIIDHDRVLVGRRRHSGKKETIEEAIDNALATAEEKIRYFAQAWSAANTEDILKRYDLGDPRRVFDGLVLNKVVWMPGYRPDEQVNMLMEAWNKEPGYTKAAFINAITRCAHEVEHKSWETVEELESTAGELLFARQWTLDIPGERTVEDLLGGW